jgi:lysophospholipase L1-like esterase
MLVRMRCRLLMSALLCFCCSCWLDGGSLGFPIPPLNGGPSSPPTSSDAGSTPIDSSVVESGTPDSGSVDAEIDAAVVDSGAPDSSSQDAGMDDDDDGAVDVDPIHVYRVMAVGDSIVAGYTDPPTWSVPFNFGWRSGLYKLLQASYPNQLKFVGNSPEPWESAFGNLVDAPFVSPDLRALDQDHHRGYGAVGTYEIAISVLDWLDQDKPDIVLLMVGINDIPVGSSEEPVQAEINLEWTVNAIVDRLPDVQIVVAQITPYSQYTSAVLAFNQFIRDVLLPNVRLRTDKVHTVDQYPALVNGLDIDPALFANGFNHPSPEAYDRMAKIWFDGLVPIFDRP